MKKNCLVIGVLGLILVGCSNSETNKQLHSGDASQTHWGNTPGAEEDQPAESHWRGELLQLVAYKNLGKVSILGLSPVSG